MTRYEILAMSAGRALDALVAEKVMGWDSSQFHFDDEMGITERLKYNEFMGDDIWVNFNPSTDISAAWEAVEKFKSQGYLFALKNIVAGEYTFSLTDWNGKCNTYSAQGKTAPLAICRAALIACLEGET